MARRALTIDGGEKIVSRIAFALIAPEQRPAGTDAMLVAYRLVDLSALDGQYAGVRVGVQFGADLSNYHAAG